MEVGSRFVLNTTTMSEEELSRSGLLATDALKGAKPGNFDHLPVLSDFVFLLNDVVPPKPAQNGRANRSQPIRPEASRASEAAGSRR